MSRAGSTGRPRRRATGLLAGALAAAVVLVGCSTGGDRTTESAVTPASVAPSSSGQPAVATDQPASDTGSYEPAEPGATPSSAPDGAAASGTDPSTTTAPESSTPAPPVATQPVAPPTAGNIDQTVADQPVTTLPPVPVDQAADFGTGVTAAVESLQRIDAVGRGPGEQSGPALSYQLSLTNGTQVPLDLSLVSVNVQDAAGTPFSPIDNDPAVPFTGTLAPGQTVSATYVFTLPSDYTAPATLSLAYSASAPIVLFAGDAQ
ncbi:hypothetical protein JL107_12870 [Nakamurella flavida]|uniref:DUF4352 domain-containing protein n=1 Tax=Nakamurella flavida TaxID=363630 RepID=A0A938YQF3_9ACTN|nr:hypothetical protein [Nakamurella flavida]MBM9477338.1 hypothetical protein [Nakamurella flavida]MDP9779794.1 cytoskeletal protein RodZ [Nakamurella flavida]